MHADRACQGYIYNLSDNIRILLRQQRRFRAEPFHPAAVRPGPAPGQGAFGAGRPDSGQL